MTKTKLRNAILQRALDRHFCGNEDVIDYYAEVYKLNIEDGRVRQNLDVAIRATMGDVCEEAMHVREKMFAESPLPRGGPGVHMDEKALKTFGQTTTLTGEDFELSFAILEVLIRTHSMTVTTTNPFDGPFPLQRFLWFLLLVTLDKE